MGQKCPSFFGIRRCPAEKLTRLGEKIVIPAEKVTSAGQITPLWWSNGGYSVEIGGETFWHLCLEDKRGVGHNAVVKVVNKEAKGIVWKDVANEGCDVKNLVEAVKKKLEENCHERVAEST
jgi:hypothetical protein